MHVLITGGTGFIGRALCLRLADAGHRLSVLTRDPSAAVRRLPPGTRVVADLAEIEEAVDGVVNLAGENLGSGRWTAVRRQRFLDSRVQLTRRLVDWMATRPPAVLVNGSAIGYYGVRGDEIVTEADPPGTVLQGGLDICSDWENEAMRAEAHGVRVCRLRIGLVLHPEGGGLQQMLLPFRLGLGGRMGSGTQWWSWIHRADLVAMIDFLLHQTDARGAYNGTAPEPARNHDFARTLASVLGRPAVMPTPAFALRLALGDMAELLTQGQRVVPARALEAGFEFRHPTLEGALRDLLAKPAST
jgi:uncharacterized protein (TIGR01777 family)